MAQIKTLRDTNNIASAKIKIDMSEKIALLNPSATPFITFMKRAKGNSEVTNNPKFSWLEDDLGARWDVCPAGATNVATSIGVSNGDYFTPNDLVKVPRTGEVFLITSISTNTLTVVRGFGTTAGATINASEPLVIIGNVNEEGAKSREMRSTLEVEKFNYTQIFRTSFGITNTMNATSTYGQNDLSYQQKKKGIEHAIDMARQFYFGEKKLDTTGTAPKRATGGLLSFLTSNNYDAGGQLTQAEFDQNICEKIFQYGSHEKLMLASARTVSVINGWALGKLQIEQGESTFGLNVTKYVSPFGVLNIVYEPLFEGATYGGHSVILDVENIKYRALKGRDTTLKTNIQDNDADSRKDEYLSEAGLEVRLPQTHAVLTGVTS